MAVIAWPSYVKVRRLALWIEGATDGVVAFLPRKAKYAQRGNEVLRAALEIAPLSLENGERFRALLTSIGGRSGALEVPLTMGLAGRAIINTAGITTTVRGALNGAHSPQASTLTVNGLNLLDTIPAGALVAVGRVDSTGYQVCEVVEAATVAGDAASLQIAPRLRAAQTDNTVVVIGTVRAKFGLIDDSQARVDFTLSHTRQSLELVEVGA